MSTVLMKSQAYDLDEMAIKVDGVIKTIFLSKA